MAAGRIFTGKKVSIGIAFGVLVVAAFGAGCSGFFVDPTLTSLNITPASPSVQVTQTTSVSAYAVNSNNQGQTLTSGVSWSTSDPATATITGACANGNLCGSATISGVAAGTATITASSQNVNATATLTVFLPAVTNFQVCQGTFGSTTCSSSGGALNFHAGTGGITPTFIAQGTSGGTVYDLTTSSTWTLTQTPTTGSISCTNSGTSPETCTIESGTSTGTYPVTVTYSNGNSTATLNIILP